jgi:hypothetical protein
MVHKIGFLVALAATIMGVVTNQEIKIIRNNPSDTIITRTR